MIIEVIDERGEEADPLIKILIIVGISTAVLIICCILACCLCGKLCCNKKSQTEQALKDEMERKVKEEQAQSDR